MSGLLTDYNDFNAVCGWLVSNYDEKAKSVIEGYSYKTNTDGTLIRQSFYWAFLADIDPVDVALPATVERSSDWWNITLRILSGNQKLEFEYILAGSGHDMKTVLFFTWYENDTQNNCYLHECNEEQLGKLVALSLLNIIEEELRELKAEPEDDEDPAYFIYRKKQLVIAASRKASALDYEKKIYSVIH